MDYKPHGEVSWTAQSIFYTPVENTDFARNAKPDNWGAVTKSFNEGNFNVNFSLSEALCRIERGAVWVAAQLKKKNEDGFICAWYVALDFDGKNQEDPTTIDDVLNLAHSLDMPPLFYYKTYSNTPDKPRFRFVWKLSQLIDDSKQYKDIISQMIDTFKSDAGAKAASQFWAGGTDIMVAVEPVSVEISTFNKPENDTEEKKPHDPYISKELCGNLSETSINAKKSRIRNVDYEHLSCQCALWHKTVDLRGEEAHWATYGEIRLLALSAHRIEGGAVRLRKAIRENPQYYDNEAHNVKYYLNAISNLKQYENAERCSASNCPFYEACGHKGFITDKVRKEGVRRYEYQSLERIPVDEAQAQLSAYIGEAVKNRTVGISLIKAPVGLGKTEALIHTDYRGQRVLIALPTHELKGEIVARWEAAGVPVVFQEEPEYAPEDRAKRDRYWRAGLPCPIRPLNTVDNAPLYRDECRVALTTQDYLLSHFEQLAEHYDLIIFDEDFTKRLYKAEAVDIGTLEMFILLMENRGVMPRNAAIHEWLAQAKDTPQNTPLPSIPYTEIAPETMIEQMSDKLPPFNIWALMDSTSIAKGDTQKKKHSISYVMRKDVPKCRLVVLSATADEAIYKKLYGDTFISFKEVPPVEQRGTVTFDAAHPYSVSYIQKTGLEACLSELKAHYADFFARDYKIITYGKYTGRKAFLRPHLVDKMYFYNTEGKDTLNGQNLLILGTPRIPMNAVISMALAAGYTPSTTALANRRLRRCGLEMDFYGFEDDTLNDLLLWHIDSETIQAIGRARLIWNDCEVLVAGMPVEV